MTTSYGSFPASGIPLPIVRLNRWTIVVSIVVAFLVQQPWITTLLLVALLGSVLIGPGGSLVFQIRRLVLRHRIVRSRERGEVEDRRLMRFNNSIAVIFLGAAQIAFLTGAASLGWILAGVVALAASIALLGFCVGCFVFFRFRLAQFRWRLTSS
jgi:hypothetical protein